MNRTGTLTAVVACHFAIPAWLPAQQVKPQTNQEYECYVQAAEARMGTRKPLAASGSKIDTTPGNGANPHKISGAMIYDWIGTVFIPGTTVDRTVRMLQDYDHRAQYFPEIISTSKLLCRSGEERFGFSMRLKEPAVIDIENDVVWERVDATPLAVPFLLDQGPGGRQTAQLPAPSEFVLAFQRDGPGRLGGSRDHHAERRIRVVHAHARVHDGNQPGEVAPEDAGVHARVADQARPGFPQTAGGPARLRRTGSHGRMPRFVRREVTRSSRASIGA